MPNAPKVLIVDDDRDIVLAARLRLQAAGYTVLTAGDGEQGLAAADEHHPDVILLDVRMPGKDGLSVLAELRRRADARTTPVIMLSASLMDRRRALDLGARYFLDKPYARDLTAVVGSALAEAAGGGN